MAIRPVEPTELLGRWQLSRQVRDELAGQSGSAAGRLTLHTEGEDIAWREQGTFRWNGSELPFTRSYRLRRVDAEWWLFFNDGRPFHAWHPGRWMDHPCRDDVYRGLISVAGPDSWRTEWELRGPGKDQLITTQFSRGRG